MILTRPPKKRGARARDPTTQLLHVGAEQCGKKLKPEAAVLEVGHGPPTPRAARKLKPKAAVQEVGLGTPTPRAAWRREVHTWRDPRRRSTHATPLPNQMNRCDPRHRAITTDQGLQKKNAKGES